MICKDLSSGLSFNISRNAGYMTGVFLKTLEQVLVCYKLDKDQTQFSAAALSLITLRRLLVMIVGNVTVTVVKDATSCLAQDCQS